jgi:hypothetical protein
VLLCLNRYFLLKFRVSEHANVPVEGSSPTFKVTPAKMKLAVNTVGDGDYTADSFPKVVRLEGNPSDTPDVDGLPSVIKVALLDSDGSVLSSANCLNCMGARLVKCDDSTPTSGTTDGSTPATAMPACGGLSHFAAITQAGGDQMIGLSQAVCQVLGPPGDCGYPYGGNRQTLSSSPNSQTGTVSDVVNGMYMHTHIHTHEQNHIYIYIHTYIRIYIYVHPTIRTCVRIRHH